MMQRRNLLSFNRPANLHSCLMLVGVLILAVGFFASRRSVAQPLKWYRLESVRSQLGVTGRSMTMLPAGLCIVLHYPPTASTVVIGDSLPQGEAASTDRDGEIITAPAGYWHDKVSASQEDQSRFNCVTFALGDALGLTSRDWVEPLARVETAFSTPAQVILDSLYERVAVYSGTSPDWAKIQADEQLMENDVFCYVMAIEGRPQSFAHMGKITQRNGKHMLISKIGTGPIVRSTLKRCGDEYAGQFTELQVYRKLDGSRYSF